MTEIWAKPWILKVVWLQFERDKQQYEKIEKTIRQTSVDTHAR